jgi:phage gpG-like protein
VVTNRLRGSIRASKAVVTSGGIHSALGTNVGYAGVHEFGFEGKVTVKAHTRRIYEYAQGTATQAVLDPRTGRISRTKAPKRKTTGVIQVRTHTRNVKMPARAFIRRTIEARSGAYSVAIGTALSRIFS